MTDSDVIIIGSGMGGATVAAALAPSGCTIQILERGHALLPTDRDRDADAIFRLGRFRSDEEWLDANGSAFHPGNYYYVGGNSKFYGAALIRFRKEDFRALNHMGGTTLGWPITYDDLEPYYQEAEILYRVRGTTAEDPTEPPHSGAYRYPPVPDEPPIVEFRNRLARLGLHPASIPLGVDLARWLQRGKTPWDAFPDTCGGKMDAETVGIAKALAYDNVTLRTGCKAVRLIAANDKRITGVEVESEDRRSIARASVFVLAAGAVQSAALLLASADTDHPAGLANSSDMVGRNFMNHNCSAVLAIHPFRKNDAVYQKTLMLNDFYLTGGPHGEPLGNIQLLGKISATILAANSPLPMVVANWIARRSVDIYAMSEDLPHKDSRVTLRNARIVLDWRRSNWSAHSALVAKLKIILRKAGYPIVLSKPFDRRTPSHQCGTARMGRDPRRSVVDIHGRSHDHNNLFLADASVLPTSAAVNPALTVAALSLRTADHIARTDLAL